MVNCHQNEKDGQKGHETALNSQNCFLLTFFSRFKQHPILNLANYVNFLPFGCTGSPFWRPSGKK